MIENIPELYYMDLAQWTKEMHIGYVKGVKRRFHAEFDEDNPAPPKVQEVLTPFDAAVDKEDSDYELSRKDPLTADIDKADTERDQLLPVAVNMIDNMAKATALPQMQQAAQLMQGPLQLYHPSTRSSLRDESTEIEQWLQAIHDDPAQTQAAQTLGLTAILAELEVKNNLVISLMDQRATGRAGRADSVLADDRKETDRWLHNLMRILDAAACMDSDDDRFLVLISNLQEDQKEWKRQYDDYRRSNRRIVVKSKVVGKHLYAVSAHATWLQVAQKYPKLLAADPAPSAAGTLPVVVPVRIVSVEKEAVKAGGLAVALNGVLVKPTDEVDFTKDYALVLYDGTEPDVPEPDKGGDEGEVTPVTPE